MYLSMCVSKTNLGKKFVPLTYKIRSVIKSNKLTEEEELSYLYPK